MNKMLREQNNSIEKYGSRFKEGLSFEGVVFQVEILSAW